MNELGRYIHIDCDERTALLELLQSTDAKKDQFASLIRRLTDYFDTTKDDQVYIELAKQKYHCSGEIEIDENAIVSEGDEGAYVAAWVWVRRE